VDPVPDSLLLKKSGSAGNGTRTSGSVAKNSDHHRGCVRLRRNTFRHVNLPTRRK
jgi:hypothetical protein